MQNVVFIHTHDTGRFLSPYGYAVPSPNLLAFAKESLTFRNAFCASPTCSPSRASLMTGRFPHTNGMLALSQRGTRIYDQHWHLASCLQRYGYLSVLCGVQHEQDFWRSDARATAASEWLGYEQNISASDDFVRNDTDLLLWDQLNAENAADFIRQRTDERPFFLSFGMHATHRIYPALTKADYAEFDPTYLKVPETMQDNVENRYDTACLHKSIKSFDQCFQTVIQALKEKQLYENTMIIYTTDHGLANPFAKCTLRDAGIGVALLMRLPGHPASYGRVYDGLISHVDLLPTLFTALQLPLQKEWQGKSFYPAFDNPQQAGNDEIFAEVNFHTSFEPQRCIRTKRYKYIRFEDEAWQHYNLSNCDDSIVKEQLITQGFQTLNKEPEQLYDLLFDPNEQHNLIKEEGHQEVLEDLRKRLSSWRERTHDHVLTFEEYAGKIKVNRKESIHASSQHPEDYESLIL